MARRFISTLHIVKLAYRRQISTSVIVTNLEVIVGYRSGQLIKIVYNGKECKVKEKYNRTLKSEGFLSKASSAIFGNDESYQTHFKGPVRQFSEHPKAPGLHLSYQVGRKIVFAHEMKEKSEHHFFNRLESMRLEEAFAKRFKLDTLVQETNNILLYGCQYYYSLKDYESKISILMMNEDTTSYLVTEDGSEILVALSTKEVILVINAENFALKGTIQTEMPIRKLSTFVLDKQEYLFILPYENYVLLLNRHQAKYCKLSGHRSYVGNAIYGTSLGKLVTAGMDHRISTMAMTDIKEENWLPVKITGSTTELAESDVPEQRFKDIFSLG